MLAGVLLLVRPWQGAERPTGRTGADGAVIDLGERVARFASALREDATYRPPDPHESELTAKTVNLLSQGDGDTTARAADILGPLGFTVETGTDSRTGRGIILIASQPGSERAWGLYVVDRTRPADVVVEVPHPVADLHTETIGVAMFRSSPGALMIMSGTHRRVGNGAGDVAHRADSMFHIVADTLAMRRLPQVQLHGFDNQSLPDVDVVLSPGATKSTPALRGTAKRLTDDGFAVCPAWKQDCGALEGKTNEQGRAAAEHGAEFAHVEMNKSVRDTDDRWARVVAALDAEYPAA